MRFSSKPVMGSSELYYYGYRFYDPSSQRWLNRDPISERGGQNLYAFIENRPQSLMDGNGLAIITNEGSEPILISGNIGGDHGSGTQFFAVVAPGGIGGGQTHPLPAYSTPEAAWLAYNDPMMRDPYPEHILDVDWYFPPESGWPAAGEVFPANTKVIGDAQGPMVILDKNCNANMVNITVPGAYVRRGMEKVGEVGEKLKGQIDSIKSIFK